MYQNLLIPTDGSDCSNFAVEAALDFAKEINATVTFLYVVEDPMSMAYSVPEAVMYTDELYKGVKQAGVEILAKAKARADEVGLSATTILAERQYPVEAILQFEKDFDLVVMGTHGRRGIRHLLLGSVTEEVIRRSTKPFMVIRASES